MALNNAHGVGTSVFGGPSNSFSKFGGTSSATPLAAGVGALLLSVRPALTWVQVRDILRSTAVPIDTTNTDPVGIWVDVNGTPSNVAGYLGPFYSRWYGSGRVDALAAVNEAVSFGAAADVLVRDNLGDNGTVPSTGRFWNSPDIWVRNLAPIVEGAAALPATYSTPGSTQDADASHDNYIYVRVKNVGPVPTSTFYIRVYLSHWAGTEFVYPDNFIPSNHPGQPLPSPLVPGTYLIGEVQHGVLAANASDIVNVVWPLAAIPPHDVVVSGMTVHWHPCLLVKISPQDGPLPSGSHVWDNNNLGQKNVSINYAANDRSFSAALVAGNLLNMSDLLEVEVDRTLVPAGVRLFIDILDPKVKREVRRLVQRDEGTTPCVSGEVVLLEDARVMVETSVAARSSCPEGVITLPRCTHLKLATESRGHAQCSGLTVGYFQGREVFWLSSRELVNLPLPAGRGVLVALIVGGAADKTVKPGSYLIGLTQRNADGSTSGAAAVELRIR